ncbi:hypothetical protein VSS74_26705 [Conexibacter stalactiti]|uniref:PBP domain-containing protein n=1 Tax=Conexibacter stalactiti TaxID=1940611 RepID=A0ABU4HYL2_9ACTN|nr:hypothetical protein [Conexibacter stalactiti]MDW5597974.1 hypothetical protein [Conexibacter stalactiti]MEC5038616.1 hypothetical protein [Conexibacter stalactiti]
MASPAASRAPRRALAAGIAVLAVGAGAFGATDAHAAFTIAECQGAPGVRIQGASFQNAAQSYWKSVFEGSNGCGGAPTAPIYSGNGSGNGLASMGAGRGSSTLLCVVANTCRVPLDNGVRDGLSAAATTDEPPTADQISLMEAGLPGDADNGIVHVIPVATGATTLILHAPEGCNIGDVDSVTNGADGAVADTGDSAANFTQRIRVSNEDVEAAFAGVATTWGDIAPGITGDPRGISGGDQTNATEDNCAEVPVRRIVRPDVSGTTYGWKAYLQLINPTRGWLSRYSSPNTDWPSAGSGRATIVVGQGATCPVGADKVCVASSTSAGPLSDAVRATDGSIGYADLATARARGFEITPAATAAAQDYTFWSPLQTRAGNATPGAYAEPTFDALAHVPRTGGKGANCQTVTLSGVPTPAESRNGDPTLGNWGRAAAAGGASYGACVLTYTLAWDDSSKVYGGSAAEEAKARTVKDYLRVIVSSYGQALTNQDYSPLPNSRDVPLADYARAAVNAIDWNKGGGGGEQRPPVVVPPVVVPPVVRPPVVNPPAAPSNVFSIPSSKSTASLITFSVQLPGAGALKAEATTKVGRRTIKVATVSASPRGAGRVTLRLNLSAAAKKALARAKGKKLKVAVKFTFTPTGGTANTVTRTVTVKAAARRAARRKAKR